MTVRFDWSAEEYSRALDHAGAHGHRTGWMRRIWAVPLAFAVAGIVAGLTRRHVFPEGRLDYVPLRALSDQARGRIAALLYRHLPAAAAVRTTTRLGPGGGE